MISILRIPRAPAGALLAASALAASALPVPPAAAAPPLEREQRTYDRLYERVRDAGGDPGRHIVDDGLRPRDRAARPARAHELAKAIRTLRRMTGQPARAAGATGPSAAGAGLEGIAACESGGDPTAVSADGTYRGKYQFDHGTWQSVGGTGDPAAAPEVEQDARAAALAARQGTSPWPSCG